MIFISDDQNVKNDIAVLQLAEPINFSKSKVAPACISRSSKSSGGMCKIAGWGDKG